MNDYDGPTPRDIIHKLELKIEIMYCNVKSMIGSFIAAIVALVAGSHLMVLSYHYLNLMENVVLFMIGFVALTSSLFGFTGVWLNFKAIRDIKRTVVIESE